MYEADYVVYGFLLWFCKTIIGLHTYMYMYMDMCTGE